MKQKQPQSAFFTRAKANEGVDLPLLTPSGETTEHWIKIRGVDSDAVKQYEAESRRRVFEAASNVTDKSIFAKMEEDEALGLLVALVMAWSFDEPCTPDNVRKFLREAPQIAEQINRLSTRRSLFFGNSSQSSTPSPALTSS